MLLAFLDTPSLLFSSGVHFLHRKVFRSDEFLTCRACVPARLQREQSFMSGLSLSKRFWAISGLIINFFRNDGHFCRQLLLKQSN